MFRTQSRTGSVHLFKESEFLSQTLWDVEDPTHNPSVSGETQQSTFSQSGALKVQYVRTDHESKSSKPAGGSRSHYLLLAAAAFS